MPLPIFPRQALVHFMRTRFVEGKGAPRQGESGGHQAVTVGHKEARTLLEKMGACFDLRALCVEPCSLTDRVDALRFVHAAAVAAGAEPAPLATLEPELEELRKRLVAAGRGSYKGRWFDKDGVVIPARKGGAPSGVVIMEALFTEPDLYLNLGGILALFEQSVLKTRNEAVVEGMGSIVSYHADPQRHLSLDMYNMEGFVDYNGPPLQKVRFVAPPHRPAPAPVCVRALCFASTLHAHILSIY